LTGPTYINAPYPDEENPGDFFWGRDGSIKDAIRCYNIGRSLLQHCRTLLSEGKLVATGLNSAGRRQTISSREWLNLWPMFATNKAAQKIVWRKCAKLGPLLWIKKSAGHCTQVYRLAHGGHAQYNKPFA
jgi:hypothetical protein